MTLYRVGGEVRGSCYVGEFHANDAWDAIEQARDQAGVSLCHECAREISDPEVTCLWAEDDSGDCTSEPSDHDEIVRQSKEIVRLLDEIAELNGRLSRMYQLGYEATSLLAMNRIMVGTDLVEFGIECMEKKP